MRITPAITIASTLLLAFGCAQEERSVQTNETSSPGYGYSSGRHEYNGQNKLSSGTTGETETPQASYAHSDNTIVTQARETLAQDPEIAFVVPNIKISSNNGAVTLSGSVQSEAQKRQIFSKVQGIAGVVNVNNQLNVTAVPSERENSNGSPLDPTSNSGSERLYKDAANGGDPSTNNVLNPTSNQKEAGPLYRESSQNQNTNNMAPNDDALNPTSRTNSSSQIYQQSNPNNNGQDHNTDNNQQMP